MKYVINRVSIKSVAKVSALLHCILFFLTGVIYGGVLIILSIVNISSGADLTSSGISLALSILSLIGLPIGGLIYGFVMGAIISLLYNFISDFVGGLELSVSEKLESPSKAPIKKSKKQ